jgi:hypothetical protein
VYCKLRKNDEFAITYASVQANSKNKTFFCAWGKYNLCGWLALAIVRENAFVDFLTK